MTLRVVLLHQLPVKPPPWRAHRVKLDEAKDTAHDSGDLNKVLSKDTITSLLAAQNFDMPAGYAMDGDTEYLVRVWEMPCSDVSELKDLAACGCMGLMELIQSAFRMWQKSK